MYKLGMFDEHEPADPRSPEGHYDWVTGEMARIEAAFVGLQRREHGFAEFAEQVRSVAEEIVAYAKGRYDAPAWDWPVSQA